MKATACIVHTALEPRSAKISRRRLPTDFHPTHQQVHQHDGHGPEEDEEHREGRLGVGHEGRAGDSVVSLQVVYQHSAVV